MVKKNQAVQQSSFCDLFRHFSLSYELMISEICVVSGFVTLVFGLYVAQLFVAWYY